MRNSAATYMSTFFVVCRIGIATLLAECGYTDEEIQAIGRWSSSCFQTYIRRPRVTRVRTARRLAATVELGGLY